MVALIEASVRPAEERDRRQLGNLLHFEAYVHRHLDWRPPLEWLGEEPFLVVERGGRVVGALASPPDPPKVAWVRFFAVRSGSRPQEVWEMLWPEARDRLVVHHDVRVAAIPLHNWFQSILRGSGFEQIQEVVMLAWEGESNPAAEAEASVRPMSFDDLDVVQEVDEAAFEPLWRNSLTSLRLAFRQVLQASVAEKDGRILGYQITTRSPLGAHLARLAVRPEAQGKGVGYALINNLLDKFGPRGAVRVTVNTQNDNIPSLALYKKAGFRLTGEKFPVYLLKNAGISNSQPDLTQRNPAIW